MRCALEGQQVRCVVSRGGNGEMRCVSGGGSGEMQCAPGRQRVGAMCLGGATSRVRCAMGRQRVDVMCLGRATDKVRCATGRQWLDARGGDALHARIYKCYVPTATPAKDTSVLAWVVTVRGVPELEVEGFESPARSLCASPTAAVVP